MSQNAEQLDDVRGPRLVRPPKGGTGGGVSGVYGRITAVEGASPPYLYSIELVEPADDHAWSTTGETCSECYNLAELDDYPGSGKVAIGRPVFVYRTAFDWRFNVDNHRGVYPGDG